MSNTVQCPSLKSEKKERFQILLWKVQRRNKVQDTALRSLALHCTSLHSNTLPGIPQHSLTHVAPSLALSCSKQSLEYCPALTGTTQHFLAPPGTLQHFRTLPVYPQHSLTHAATGIAQHLLAPPDIPLHFPVFRILTHTSWHYLVFPCTPWHSLALQDASWHYSALPSILLSQSKRLVPRVMSLQQKSITLLHFRPE